MMFKFKIGANKKASGIIIPNFNNSFKITNTLLFIPVYDF